MKLLDIRTGEEITAEMGEAITADDVAQMDPGVSLESAAPIADVANAGLRRIDRADDDEPAGDPACAECDGNGEVYDTAIQDWAPCAACLRPQTDGAPNEPAESDTAEQAEPSSILGPNGEPMR